MKQQSFVFHSQQKCGEFDLLFPAVLVHNYWMDGTYFILTHILAIIYKTMDIYKKNESRDYLYVKEVTRSEEFTENYDLTL